MFSSVLTPKSGCSNCFFLELFTNSSTILVQLSRCALDISYAFDKINHALCNMRQLNNTGGHLLAWVGICRHLGVYLSSARTFKCCFDNCKASFYRSFNAIYGRLGRCASPEVIVHLLSSKCMPVLLYGLDSCPATSLNYAHLSTQ